MAAPSLRLEPCSYAEALQSVQDWHYSKSLPAGRYLTLGVTEGGRFIGLVVFANSVNRHIGSPFAMCQKEVCELARVALDRHETPTSRIVAIAIRLMKKHNPSLRMVISFADPAQGHHGGIYQAGGWVYADDTKPADEYLVNGRRMHGRALRAARSKHKLKNIASPNVFEWACKVIDPQIQRVKGSTKHRYLMPLDPETRAKILPLSKPYPKRATSIAGDVPGSQPGEGGSIPTVALSQGPS